MRTRECISKWKGEQKPIVALAVLSTCLLFLLLGHGVRETVLVGAASNTVRTGRGNREMIGVSGLAIRLCLEPRRVGTTSLEMLQRSSSSPPLDQSFFSSFLFSLPSLFEIQRNSIRSNVWQYNIREKERNVPTFLLVIVATDTLLRAVANG